MVGVVKILCYLFVGIQCLVLLVLVALVISETANYDRYIYKKENYNAEVSCNNKVVDLVISD
jgi:putative flippase GtrA